MPFRRKVDEGFKSFDKMVRDLGWNEWKLFMFKTDFSDAWLYTLPEDARRIAARYLEKGADIAYGALTVAWLILHNARMMFEEDQPEDYSDPYTLYIKLLNPKGYAEKLVEAYRKLYGHIPETGSAHALLEALQPWKAKAYVKYGGGEYMYVKSGERSGKEWVSAKEYNAILLGFSGFIAASSMITKLPRWLKAYAAVAALQSSESERFPYIGFRVGYRGLAGYRISGEEIVLDGPIKRYPLMDGYTRAEMEDPGLRGFEEAVEDEIAKRGGKLSAEAKRIWGVVKDAVRAHVPAYYTLYGYRAENAPRDVAYAILELARMHRALLSGERLSSEAARIAEVIEEIGAGSAEEAERIARILVPEDAEAFAAYRIPYVLYLIGKKAGTAVDLGMVFRHAYGSDNPAVKLSLVLLEAGVVSRPSDIREALEAARRGKRFSDALVDVLATRRSEVSVYTAFFALGMPVAAKMLDLLDAFIPLKYMINPKVYAVSMISGKAKRILGIRGKTSFGDIFFGLMDAVARAYAATAVRHSALKKPEEDPSVHRGLLYMFADVPLDGEVPKKEITYRLDMILGRSAGYVYAAREKIYGKAEKLAKKVLKGKQVDTSKIERVIRAYSEKAEEALDELLSEARIYVPKYIEHLGKYSRAFAEVLVEIIDERIMKEEAVKPITERMVNPIREGPFTPYYTVEDLVRERKKIVGYALKEAKKRIHATRIGAGKKQKKTPLDEQIYEKARDFIDREDVVLARHTKPEEQAEETPGEEASVAGVETSEEAWAQKEAGEEEERFPR